MIKMITMKIREIIIADRKDGMTINAISKAVRVSESTIYRLFLKKQKTGSIEPRYYNCGKKPEVTAEKLIKMESLVIENTDITLEEIKEAMHLSMQKSEISNILRNKLGFRFKKRWYMPVNETDLML
jgi:transposase